MKTIKLQDFVNKIEPKFGDILLFLQAKGLLDNLVICGSMGLVLNNKLNRQVNDLDFLEIKSNYGNNIGHLSQEYRSKDVSSCLFKVSGKKKSCWKINIFNTKVEFLHNINWNETATINIDNTIEYEEVILLTYDNIPIKVKIQSPQAAIDFKKEYVKSPYLIKGHKKHIEDLIKLESEYIEPVIDNLPDELPW